MDDVTCHSCDNKRGSFIFLLGYWYCLKHFPRFSTRADDRPGLYLDGDDKRPVGAM